MRILKRINNNIVSARDETGQEVVVMGRGIGFNGREGQQISEHTIEKVFRMTNSQEIYRLKELFASLPQEHIDISNRIIAHAKEVLDVRLSESIYLTLTDHISFAISRYQQGYIFRNALLEEVRRFYTLEFKIGLYALDLIEKELGIVFTENEAASIALHIVNAEYETTVSEAFRVTETIQKVMDTVENVFAELPDKNSIYVERFITHLKYMFQRMLREEKAPPVDKEYSQMVQRLYPAEWDCALELHKVIESSMGRPPDPSEIPALTVHLRRMYVVGLEEE